MEHHIKQRILKNALLSLFIYARPVILMFISFYLSGEKPWLKKDPNAKPKTTKQYKY